MRIPSVAGSRIHPFSFVAFLLIVVSGYALFARVTPASLFEHPAIPILIILLALALGQGLFYARALAAVHRGVRQAIRGNLNPVITNSAIDWLFEPLISDYNILVRNIGSLFNNMERSQEAIIVERNRNKAILSSLPGVLLTLDTEFQITLSNDRAQALFGMSAKELTGRNIFDLLKINEQGRELLREAFLYEQHIDSKEIVLCNGNQERCYALNLTFFRETVSSKEHCAALMLQDVTDVKYMQDLMHRAEKFLAIGQLAGGIAHELNTPLGTIVGYAQLLNEGTANVEKRQKYSQLIYREAQRCSRIIENLRAVARRDVCRPETCKIDEVIADVVDTVCTCPSRSHNTAIETDLAADVWVQGGAGQLDIVMVNVIMNAVQAAASSATEPRVKITSRVRAANVVVTVSDNGPGVPAAQRKEIFSPFYTTKNDGSGIGLGLAISQSMITRVGGNLRCEAECGSGARFVLTLPMAERRAA